MTGFAIPGVELQVVDSSDNEVAHDGIAMGEIAVRGDGVMEGYWRQPKPPATPWRVDGFIPGTSRP